MFWVQNDILILIKEALNFDGWTWLSYELFTKVVLAILVHLIVLTWF